VVQTHISIKFLGSSTELIYIYILRQNGSTSPSAVPQEYTSVLLGYAKVHYILYKGGHIIYLGGGTGITGGGGGHRIFD
jgi:N-acetylmuramic acid 6-phosphate (MurNAc-6-P) etherase